ncbi:unnamed protein product [Macrosiphum euphorbiae]|uniref:Uncharacterized protein n=1 Tax=Macrosiphum euphorbiae TaxID=13131 RepID=A0AAV0YB72_9HEMI|nr:unnamed protein product [Macrosiphum euphorbiae]
MKELREQNMKLTETNDKLSSEIRVLKIKVDELEQKTLEKVIEIMGVPLIQNEDCKNTVKGMISKLNIECDVVKAYRISSKQKTDTKIIAWLSDTNAKNNSKEKQIDSKSIPKRLAYIENIY